MLLFSIANDLEAQGSLNAALEMKKQGKMDKALRLFEHAYVLSPLHPDVLNHYGEFMEDTQKDIITADQFYFQVSSFHLHNIRCKKCMSFYLLIDHDLMLRGLYPVTTSSLLSP